MEKKDLSPAELRELLSVFPDPEKMALAVLLSSWFKQVNQDPTNPAFVDFIKKVFNKLYATTDNTLWINFLDMRYVSCDDLFLDMQTLKMQSKDAYKNLDQVIDDFSVSRTVFRENLLVAREIVRSWMKEEGQTLNSLEAYESALLQNRADLPPDQIVAS